MITLSNNSQSRWKDSVASASSIDLCLIANGEEKTQVLTSKGNIVLAGFEPPTVAPSIVDVGAGDLTNASYAGYAYVYAATSRYPTVQSNQAAGGNVSPRSNVSPSTVYQFTGVGNRSVSVTTTKTDRQDVDKIWIYRTQLFSSLQQATEAANGGQLFYIGSVNNDGIAGTISYTDNSLVLQEQVESDNLIAPTAQFTVYYNPYFFLLGQNDLEIEVSIDINGVITILNSYEGTWFTGRNGQFVKFKGIDTGGFDGYGQFYFKWLTDKTAQLTLDFEGTQVASTPYTGTTRAKIFGYSTSLYRSKPNNPFAWGETVALGSSVVSQSWVTKVGGGNAIAMAVIPNSSLLKVDLQNPPQSYIFNLKQTQSEAFKGTRRLISDTYIPSSNFCQFSGLDENRQLQTFALDTRNFCIIQTDGGNVIPISDMVKETVRNVIKESTEHTHFHGFYDPNTELNCFVYREEGGLPSPHKLIYNHAPSRQWGMVDCFDLLCSSVIQDKFSGRSIVLGGSASGFVGQVLKDYKPINWISQNPQFALGSIVDVEDIEQVVGVTPPSASEELDGRYFVMTGTSNNSAQFVVFWYSLNGLGSHPILEVSYTNGKNHTIYYAKISYTLADTVAQIAQTIGDAISYGCSSGGLTDFPLRFQERQGIIALIRWKRPVLYFNPLDEFFDYNSGTTFSLITQGGATITYQAPYWDNTDTVDKEKVIGNWAIFEKTKQCSESGIVWGRIKDIELTEVENTFRLYFDLLYVPSLSGFIFELSTFMVTPTTAEDSFLVFQDGTFLLLADGASKLILESNVIPNGFAYIGQTESFLKKYLDLNEASTIKQLNEFWCSAREVSQYPPYDSLLMGYHNELDSDVDVYNILNQDKSVDGSEGKDNWFVNKTIEVEPFKLFGFSVLHRGPTNLSLSNITLKM